MIKKITIETELVEKCRMKILLIVLGEYVVEKFVEVRKAKKEDEKEWQEKRSHA